MRSLTSLLSLVVLGVLVLVLLHTPGRGEDVVVLSGRVEGEAPEGKFPVGFHFFDKEKRDLVHRAVGELEVRSGKYTASLPQGPLRDGGEYYVMATSPEVEIESYQGQPAEAWGLVRLQPSTPGIQQTGHVNVSGTLIAGAVKTNALQMSTGASAGSVLTSDASGNASWQPLPPGASLWALSGSHIFNSNSGFVGIGTTSPAYPLHVVTSSGGRAIYGVNTGTTGIMYGVLGEATAATGAAYGVAGQTSSTGGVGVFGLATAATGSAWGVYGRSESTGDGRGVVGVAIGASGPTTGTVGASLSPDGRGVWGVTYAQTGTNYGVFGESASSSGRGVYGLVTAASGNTYGVYGRSSSPSGTGVFGENISNTGVTYGMWGQTSSPDGRGVYGVASATTGTNFGVYGRSASPSGTGVFGENISNTGVTYGMWGQTSSPDGRGVYGLASATTGTNFGVYGYTASTDGRGVAGHASAATGATYGVIGLSASTSGAGVIGLVTASTGLTTGVIGQSHSPSGRGVYGENTSETGVTYGVHGQAYSADGRGVYGRAFHSSGINFGVYGSTISTSGRGVAGEATAPTGETYGVFGLSASTGGAGVMGLVTNSVGLTTGVVGQSNSSIGRGVYGVATATSGTTVGVRAEVNSMQMGSYGLLGVEPSGSAGHAIIANGSFAASGTKSFQIDHPLWPETHFLNHFCTEAPEPLNAYSGNVVTDARGYATVQLPDYFDSINRDFRYQLTVIDDSDDFVLAKVVRKIQNNQFVIRTNKPRVEVSWEVKGIRNDPYVRKYGYETEQEKEDEIKGKYLHPELYGMPKEYGIHYRQVDLPDPKPSTNDKGPKTTKSPKSR
ncbi:MAG: hypothetical protein HND42_05045 [Armatimonadetes bacterium]|nr:hypothetical protein [Armatimonadota bacterium]